MKKLFLTNQRDPMKKISDTKKLELVQFAKLGLAFLCAVTIWKHLDESNWKAISFIILVDFFIFYHLIVIEYRLKYKLGLIDWERVKKRYF